MPPTNYREYFLKALVPIIIITFFFMALFVYVTLAGPVPFSVDSVVNNKNDNFTVTGEGEVSVKPDVAVVRVGVEANAKTAKDAQERINQVSNAVIDAVKELGIDQKDIKTENYNIYPEYSDNLPVPATATTIAPAPPSTPATKPDSRINNYRASSNLVIKVRDMEKANGVIDAASSKGANVIGGVSFEVDDRSKAEAGAREEAIKDAKQKAEQAAKAGGFKLGKLLNYYEDLYGGPRPLYEEVSKYDVGRGGGVSTNIEPGSSEVMVTVTLSYEIR